ncbi:MAG: rod shape-determining protein RodA [Bacteroidaceae bacterium]
MATKYDESKSPFRSLDWLTIGLYIALLAFGWFSVCGASYDYGSTDMFDFASRSGKQLLWISCSFGLGFILLMLDDRFYDSVANFVYVGFMVLLLITPFLATDTKGSLSWIKFGSVSLQPAEFAKCATALAIAKLMGTYGFSLQRRRDFLYATAIILLPIALIVMQKETGSALVYFAFFLMFYREGMPGCILFAAFAAVLYFVVGVSYDAVPLFTTGASLGKVVVLIMIWLFTLGMLRVYTPERKHVWHLFTLGGIVILLAFGIAEWLVAFEVSWVILAVCVTMLFYLIYQALSERLSSYFYIALFTLGSVGFFYSSNYVLNNVLQQHQRDRVNLLLGLSDDPSGVGYNVNQSKIAIGSGGLEGKGFLNGTQTKLKYVPEQDTDFIFCTVGEEEGFMGSSIVLLLFLALILRLIYLSERQPYGFGRVYGYCVLSIFLFHLFINVGMVLGLTPVIGIPLPFFSYGGSSLWGFTLLLFIFLRLDAGRNRSRR